MSLNSFGCLKGFQSNNLMLPSQSRYGRHTPMAKQLREEPSLQLCAVLLRYALQADAAAVQADLAERHLPSLSTLRQVTNNNYIFLVLYRVGSFC